MTTRTSIAIAALCGICVAGASGAAAQAVRALKIDPAASRLTIAVGKSGAFSFMAGHTHEVTGPIHGTLDVDDADLSRSRLEVEIAASALKVTEKGEPPGDAEKVQKVMLSEEVLDVAKHPAIAFHTTAIAVKSRQGSKAELVASGELSLHGVTHPIAIPVHAEIGENAVTATATFTVKQTDYGMKPVSVAGVVAVKDALAITVALSARR